MNPKTFFGELKRRNVYKVAVAYGVVAPQKAIWLEDKLPWVTLDESLPMFQKTPKTSGT